MLRGKSSGKSKVWPFADFLHLNRQTLIRSKQTLGWTLHQRARIYIQQFKSLISGMSTYYEANKTVSHRFKKYIDNVVALKMFVDARRNNLCQCLIWERERERSVHEKKCVVGLCLRAWKKSEELLNLVTRVYSVHKSES